MKVPVSTSIEDRHYKLVESLAVADETTPAAILRKAITRGLSSLEKEVLGAAFVGGGNGHGPAPAREEAEVLQ